MRIFVCEYITGGGLASAPLPQALAHEGDLMVRALARDLADIPGTELVVSRDPRLPPLPVRCETVVAGPAQDIWTTWRSIAARVDAVWPVAPETDGVLERLSTLALACDRVLLGTRPEAVAIAASKRATAARLAAHGVPVVPTYPLSGAPLALAPHWVIKPDDGVGGIGARRVRREALQALRADTTRSREVVQPYIVQPYVEGTPASLSLICREGRAWVLTANRQIVGNEDGEFRFEGVVVNGLVHDRESLARIAFRVAAALPGLWGYVGVDLLCGHEGAVVLEVNPRLTTSYVGLRAALRVNPAALVLALPGADPVMPGSTERSPIHVGVECDRVA